MSSPIKAITAEEASKLIQHEYTRACALFPTPFNSAHEGLAVLWEEFEELKKEVFTRDRDQDHLREEAVQLGAMALRFISDLCTEDIP
ncbi:MAG: hypothetical protein V3S68_09820 [Dehalococcoidia bacterium]